MEGEGMKDEFTLTKPNRFWIAAAIVAVLSSVLVGPFLLSLPWLICVPIAFGSVFVIAAEFWESITSGLGANKGEKDFRPGTVLSP
jgi:hypothetical protein